MPANEVDAMDIPRTQLYILRVDLSWSKVASALFLWLIAVFSSTAGTGLGACLPP
ncbi:hypothetical protein OE88DRAFT_741041 [Heliocybe sulcata]|uniref:Uncharacterized protein n=1 Tax=Heliocybe sulcata TaxID=5364 RepID=A0A5C3MQT8_9AGAM|nr:hypothetical protein OE88DRAFT_741041 [Heliocybe sulcata]